MREASFEAALRWAAETPFQGWDFSALEGRYQWGDPPWSYTAVIRQLMDSGMESLLDLGTGGGEFLASLAPLPRRTIAAEAWEPNVGIARRNLMPLGVDVGPVLLPPPASSRHAARLYSWSRPPRRSRRSTLPSVDGVTSVGLQGGRCPRPWCGRAWW
jgi:hypothetical protein